MFPTKINLEHTNVSAHGRGRSDRGSAVASSGITPQLTSNPAVISTPGLRPVGDARRSLEILQKYHGIAPALAGLPSKPLALQVETLEILLQGLPQQKDVKKRNDTIHACKELLMRLADTSESIPQAQYDRFVLMLPAELKTSVHDMPLIEREIDKRMAPILEKLMTGYDTGDKSQQALLTKMQRFIGATFESLRRGCHAIGKALDLDDPDIDKILIDAVARAKAACKAARENTPETNPHVAQFGFDRAKVEMVPRVRETFDLLTSTFSGTRPSIAAHNVWRTCIDPRQLELLRKLGITQESRAMGFLFDISRSYLHKMSQGWRVAMRDPGQRVTPDLIIDLHSASVAGIPHPHASIDHEFNDESDYIAAGFCETTHHYGIVESVERTPQGTAELFEFVERHKEHLRLEHDEQASAYFGAKAWKLVQIGTPKEKMAAMIQELTDDYYKKVEKADSSDDRVLAAIKLCKNLLQLHPFEDGNYRVFGILLLNRLLAAQGEPLAIFDEAHKLDGYSSAELLKEVRQGQRLVSSW